MSLQYSAGKKPCVVDLLGQRMIRTKLGIRRGRENRLMGQAFSIEHLSRRTVAMRVVYFDCDAVTRDDASAGIFIVWQRSLTARPSITYCVHCGSEVPWNDGP